MNLNKTTEIDAEQMMSTHSDDHKIARLHALDLCRGVCALGVAAYHLSIWGGTVLSPICKSLLLMFGTYGVSVFFILSGYSLAHAYERYFSGSIQRAFLSTYFRRRIGRLAPLFVAVLFLSIAGKAIVGGAKPIDLLMVLGNMTLLFGFLNPGATPVIGGWSIGVEVVFYVVFPLLMVLRERALVILAAATLLTVWISSDLSRYSTLSEGWSAYIAPANHWIFFCAGVFARVNYKRWSVRPALVLAAVIVLVCLGAIGVNGATELQIVTGWRRAALVVVCIIFVVIVGQIEVKSKVIGSLCNMMGGISYPLYLVHPLVFFALRSRVDVASVAWWLALLGVATSVAFVIDRCVDSPIQRRIKQIGW